MVIQGSESVSEVGNLLQQEKNQSMTGGDSGLHLHDGSRSAQATADATAYFDVCNYSRDAVVRGR